MLSFVVCLQYIVSSVFACENKTPAVEVLSISKKKGGCLSLVNPIIIEQTSYLNDRGKSRPKDRRDGRSRLKG